MQKKEIIITVVAAVLVILLGSGLFYFYRQHEKQKQENADLEALAALDKKEMENEYTQFALQYDELKNPSRTTRSCSNSTASRNAPRACWPS